MFIGLFYICLINKLCEKEIKYSWWGERLRKIMKLFIVVWIFYWMFKKNEWNNIVIM